MRNALFGPSGNPESFYAAGHKSSLAMPEWLANQGLNAYEYSLTRGVNIGEATARALGEAVERFGIAMSVHAPYYISLATTDEATAANTRNHFLKSLTAARWLGADRIAFHMGGIGKLARPKALELAKQRLTEVLTEADRLGLVGPKLAVETHGKLNQLGTVAEIIEVCKLSSQLIPWWILPTCMRWRAVGFRRQAIMDGFLTRSPWNWGRKRLQICIFTSAVLSLRRAARNGTGDFRTPLDRRSSH